MDELSVYSVLNYGDDLFQFQQVGVDCISGDGQALVLKSNNLNIYPDLFLSSNPKIQWIFSAKYVNKVVVFFLGFFVCLFGGRGCSPCPFPYLSFVSLLKWLKIETESRSCFMRLLSCKKNILARDEMRDTEKQNER